MKWVPRSSVCLPQRFANGKKTELGIMQQLRELFHRFALVVAEMGANYEPTPPPPRYKVGGGDK